LLPANEIIEQALRRNVPMFPELAVRELVANAHPSKIPLRCHAPAPLQAAARALDLFIGRLLPLRLLGDFRKIAKCFFYGASDRSRTDDLLITNQLLYQLSYAGVVRRSIQLLLQERYNRLRTLLQDFSEGICSAHRQVTV
jgi:hypothetical protein